MSIPATVFKIVTPHLTTKLLELYKVNSQPITKLLGDSGFETQNNSKEIDSIARELKKAIDPLFNSSESWNLGDGTKQAILLDIASTLIKASLTVESLVELDLDAEKLKRYLLDANPDASKHFSLNEKGLYQEAISIVSQYLIRKAPLLEGFEVVKVSNTLNRLTKIIDYLNAERARFIQAEDDFLKRYLQAVKDKLDCLEVFGLPRMDRIASSQSLTMAYITLSVSVTRKSHLENDKELISLNYDRELDSESISKSLPVDKALYNCRRLIIRGGAGAGKSTLMQWLAVQSANKNYPDELYKWNAKVPFFIRLRSYVEKNFPTPEKFPVQIASNFIGTMPAGWVHSYLDSGQALVLIDGVDELPRHKREDFFVALKDLVSDYSEVIYIVTSRPSGLKNSQGEEWSEWEDWLEDEGFINWTLEPMSNNNVEDFIDRWHNSLSSKVRHNNQSKDLNQIGDNLKRQLRQRIELRQLASTPLLCAMICALHLERLETLPSARLQLYRECIEMMLERRDQGRRILLDETYPAGLTLDQKVELLQGLALKLMRLKSSSLEVKRVEGSFDED